MDQEEYISVLGQTYCYNLGNKFETIKNLK